MKLKDTFIIHESEGEQILIDVSSTFAGLIRSNKTAAFIVECLKNDTTKEDIVNVMYEMYEVSRAELDRDVEKIISKLREVGALEE